MKALTLTQPRATLVAVGAKRIETRSWRTDYRGWVAIHAAKTWQQQDQYLCGTKPFWSALTAAGIHRLSELPLGAIVAVALLIKVDPIVRCDPSVPNMAGRVALRSQGLPIREEEIPFGDYTPGRYGWAFSPATLYRLPEPIPCRGRLGLWDVPPEALRLIQQAFPWAGLH